MEPGVVLGLKVEMRVVGAAGEFGSVALVMMAAARSFARFAVNVRLRQSNYWSQKTKNLEMHKVQIIKILTS